MAFVESRETSLGSKVAPSTTPDSHFNWVQNRNLKSGQDHKGEANFKKSNKKTHIG